MNQLLEELTEKREGRKVKIVVLEAREFCSGATGQSSSVSIGTRIVG